MAIEQIIFSNLVTNEEYGRKVIPFLKEESAELADALKGGRWHEIEDELGDLLFHIRAARQDLCFEMAAQIVKRLAGFASVTDEVHGFRYFDDRDLLGFVDGTENPVEQGARDATVIGAADDPVFAGGSYVIVQKYLHDLDKWNAIPVEQQEKIVGREKLSEIPGLVPSLRQRLVGCAFAIFIRSAKVLIGLSLATTIASGV